MASQSPALGEAMKLRMTSTVCCDIVRRVSRRFLAGESRGASRPPKALPALGVRQLLHQSPGAADTALLSQPAVAQQRVALETNSNGAAPSPMVVCQGSGSVVIPPSTVRPVR